MNEFLKSTRKKFIVYIIALTLLTACARHVYSPEEIAHPRTVELPITTPDEAIQYSLSIPEVQTELTKELNSSVPNYEFQGWTVSVDKESETWYLNWFKGNKKCQTPYGCSVSFNSQGQVRPGQTGQLVYCSTGWNCK